MCPERISPAEVSSATPLVSLSGVVLDTETTGLDIKVARIIQIGAVRILRGRLMEEETFERLVNPGVPIPPETTEIHGIRDADVAAAPPFSDIKPELDRFTGRSIILGYSIGFDLAVLKAAHEHAGLDWTPPRSLDVRYLVRIVAPDLPSHALETVAAWLDIDTGHRHEALGDAIMTARIFISLVPLLLKKGIRTLAEAEAACRAFTETAIAEAQAGWHEPVNNRKELANELKALARIDSYPYRHRVRDVMSSPPVMVEPQTPLHQVLRLLLEKQISSVFVHPGEAGESCGIVTERDLLRVVNEYPDDGLSLPAGKVASRPLMSVPADAFLYRAIGRMTRHRIRHLAAHGEGGEIVGALTTKDLLRLRAQDAIFLGDAISDAKTAEDLAAAWAHMALVARALKTEELDARHIAAIISRELCALTRRACEIASQELDEADEAPPKGLRWTMMVLGSGGRGESLLAMDQDNAIVFEPANGSEETRKQADAWLEKLASRVADILNLAGVSYCKGGVMAKNAEWRRTKAEWREKVSHWLRRRSPEDILNADIFFDAVAVHGDTQLADDMLEEAFRLARRSRDFLKLLAVNAARVEAPLGWFGRFKLESGRMDLKKGGIMPIFSAARVLALKHGVRARATPERLEAVRGKPDIPEKLIDDLIEAHRILLRIILGQQLRDLQEGVRLSNLVDPSIFSRHMQEDLRWALEQVPSVSGLLGDPVSYG